MKATLKRKVGPITLGEKYTDAIHEQEGTATCYAIHLTGCNRVCIEFKDKDGNIRDLWVDETRLLDATGEPVVKVEDKPPGPGTDPVRRGIK